MKLAVDWAFGGSIYVFRSQTTGGDRASAALPFHKAHRPEWWPHAYGPSFVRGSRTATFDVRFNRFMPRSTALRNHLLIAAREAARPVLDGMAAQHRHEVATTFIHAGMAAEFLLRAIVANVAPSLLFIPRNAFDKKFASAMVRVHSDPLPEAEWLVERRSADIGVIRQIAAEALPALVAHRVEIDDILNRRNAAAHMWVAEQPALRSTVGAFVRMAAVVLEHLGADPLRFWGDRHSLATSLLEEEQNLVRIDVQLQVRAAQQRVAQLRAGLDLEEAERVISTIEANGSPFVPPGPTTPFDVECPACTRRAELFVRTSDDLSDLGALDPVDWDDEGIPAAVMFPQQKLGAMLQCPVCRLRLSYPELQAAFPDMADLAHYDVQPRRGTTDEYDEIMVLHEPDWDAYPHGPETG